MILLFTSSAETVLFAYDMMIIYGQGGSIFVRSVSDNDHVFTLPLPLLTTAIYSVPLPQYRTQRGGNMFKAILSPLFRFVVPERVIGSPTACSRATGLT